MSTSIENPEPDTTAEPEADSRVIVPADTSQNVIYRHMMMAAGAGALPLPLLDVTAIAGFNLKMLRELADLYDVEFRGELAKSAVASLLTGLGTGALVMGPVFSLLKAIPGAGSLLGGLAMPGVAGGLTYATGRVFVRHFESGGTFLDFDAERFKSMFKREVKQGQEVAAAAAEAPAQPAAAS